MESEFANQTMLHPLGLAAVAVLGFALLALPRRFAIIPMVVMACLVPPAQRLTIAGFDFDLLRIMVLFGWVRVLTRGETSGFEWKPIDYALLSWALASTVAYTALYGTFAAFVNRLGTVFDAAGMYFMFRFLIRDWRDLDRVVLGFIVVSVPVAAAFVIEHFTRHNAFSIFGGVPEITMARQGRLRCQGPFPHPIIAGCFFAALMPWFAARLWRPGMSRKVGVIGLVAAGAIVYTTASSTPVMVVGLSVVGGALYIARDKLRLIRWGVVVALVGLHFVMKKPVWHLLARINVVGGSTGWHRYHLVDAAINRFDEWCLLGVKSTVHWGMGLMDVTNQYVAEGVRGGIVTLALFVLTIALAFKGVGRRLQTVRNPAHIALVWALGVSLLAHCCAFLSVTYFGQIKLLWYLTLAIIGSISPAATAAPAMMRRIARTPASSVSARAPR